MWQYSTVQYLGQCLSIQYHGQCSIGQYLGRGSTVQYQEQESTVQYMTRQYSTVSWMIRYSLSSESSKIIDNKSQVDNTWEIPAIADWRSLKPRGFLQSWRTEKKGCSVFVYQFLCKTKKTLTQFGVKHNFQFLRFTKKNSKTIVQTHDNLITKN